MRTAWFWIISTLATIGIAIELSLIVILGLRKTRLPSIVQARWGRAVLSSAGVKWTVTGAEKAGPGPYVVVPNHGSMLDIAAGFSGLQLNSRFVSRPFFFKIPFLGWGMYLAEHVSLDPKKPRDAARVLRTLGPRFERGLSLILFPEGTRSKDGELQTYKRGPFMTAIQYGIPLLPVRLKGFHEALPPGAKAPRPGTAEVIIGDPIETKELEPPAAKRLAREVEAWARAQ